MIRPTRLLAVFACAACLMMGGCEFFGGTDILDVEVPVTFSIAYPVPIPSQADIDAAPVENGQRVVPVAPMYVLLNLLDFAPELTEHQGKIKQVRVDVITHVVSTNTLDVPLQPIDIRVGTTTDGYDTATTLAFTQALEANSTAQLRANVTEVGRNHASLVMGNLQFGLGLAFDFIVPEAYMASGGLAETELLFEIVVIANAAE